MDKESLEKAQEILLQISDANIKTTDKVELLINLKHFLDPDKYSNNIRVLKLEQEKRK